jgi:hypothetical protein
MLSVFGAALALAYAAVPSLPAAIVAIAAALHLPAVVLDRRRVPPAVLTIARLPISIAMFTLLRRLARGDFGAVPAASRLGLALRSGHALHVAGVDLATTGFAALAAGPWSIAAALTLALAALLVVAARRPEAQVPSLLTLLPATTALFLPLAVTVFVAATSILRAASGRLLA